MHNLLLELEAKLAEVKAEALKLEAAAGVEAARLKADLILRLNALKAEIESILSRL